MSEAELAIFVESFRRSGFTPGLNWYRNFTRNWEILGRFPERVGQPALMIYGRYDMVPQSEALPSIAPDLEVQTLECGHWIQQEEPEQTNQLMLDWLMRRYPRQLAQFRQRYEKYLYNQ